jgi:hypothetical protein
MHNMCGSILLETDQLIKLSLDLGRTSAAVHACDMLFEPPSRQPHLSIFLGWETHIAKNLDYKLKKKNRLQQPAEMAHR